MANPRESYVTPILEIRNVSVTYRETKALESVNLAVAAGSVVAIFGPSGCGKSTLLSVVAGGVKPCGGDVFFQGRSLAGIPVHARGFPMVFQDALLLPHLTILDNVAFGLRFRGLDEVARRQRARIALSEVGLADLAGRRPAELSGGQRQRVALARACVLEPQVLLLDEPFSALDEWLKVELRDLLRDIRRRSATTILFVSHDLRDVLELADHVVILERGRVLQAGPPGEVLSAPASPEAARIFGGRNVVRLPDGTLISCAPHQGILMPPDGDSVSITGCVRAVVNGPGYREIALATDGREMVRVRTSDGADLREGDAVMVYWRAGDCVLHS